MVMYPLDMGWYNAWSPDWDYQEGGTVLHNGAVWVAAVQAPQSEPDTGTSEWQLVVPNRQAGAALSVAKTTMTQAAQDVPVALGAAVAVAAHPSGGTVSPLGGLWAVSGWLTVGDDNDAVEGNATVSVWAEWDEGSVVRRSVAAAGKVVVGDGKSGDVPVSLTLTPPGGVQVRFKATVTVDSGTQAWVQGSLMQALVYSAG
jgi:hypothetical protein